MLARLAASAGRAQLRAGMLSVSSKLSLAVLDAIMNRIWSKEALSSISAVALIILDMGSSILDWPEQIQTSPNKTSVRVRGVERPSVRTMLQTVPDAYGTTLSTLDSNLQNMHLMLFLFLPNPLYNVIQQSKSSLKGYIKTFFTFQKMVICLKSFWVNGLILNLLKFQNKKTAENKL